MADTNPLPLTAAELTRRILAGEKIPLAELKDFILAAHADTKADRKAKDKGEKDVEFF
jgi:hypothetical protein